MIWSNVLIAWTLCGPLFLILMAFEVQDAPIPTRMMAIANGTCVSFCNQPKANIFGYLTRITPASAGIWLRQESLRHILASPGYAPGTIAVNATRIEREFNAGQTCRSMYSSIFNHLWNIAIYRWRVIDFQQWMKWISVFLNHILLSPGYIPGTIAVILHGWKELDSMLIKCIAACTHLFQPFTSYSEILVGNCNFFLPHCI